MYTIQNPFNKETLGSFAYATQDEINKTLNTLNEAKRKTRKIPAFEKAMVLEKLSSLISKNQKEIAILITREVGKPITESMGEVNRASFVAKCAAEEARRLEGEILNCDAYSDMQGKKCHVNYFPLGMILAITPFNFPFNLAVHKIAPAFAAGNTVFFKPGPQNYLSGKYLVDLCYEAGIPRESLKLCMPDIKDMKGIIQDSRVNCINFTGGLIAANIISEQAGFKKLIMELGGNDPLIVLPDGNIDEAVDVAIDQRFGTAGQRCNACKRLYIHKDIYEEFKEKLLTKTKAINIGNPLEESTGLGPLINSKAADDVKARIEGAINAGATLLYGNKREDDILWPTILEDVTDEMELVAEETFGPVIPLFKFKDIEEIIPRINASRFALQAGVFTNNLSIIQTLYEELETGSLNVNAGPGFRADHMPFGGIKETGIGREGVRYAMLEMSSIKNLVL